MSRRTKTPRVGESGRRANRMAPGGRLYSESPVTSFLPSSGSGDTGIGSFMVPVAADAPVVTTTDVVTPRAVDKATAPGPYATLGAMPTPY